MSEIQAGFIVDGKVFETKVEAQDYLRKPQVLSAMNEITSDSALSELLISNKESIIDAFSTGTIRRVTKADKKKMNADFDTLEAAGLSLKFFTKENREDIINGFRYPAVQRMDAEAKAVKAKEMIVNLDGVSDELADWIVANSENIIKAYDAGKPKREIAPAAQEALEAYRARKAKEKADAEAAKATPAE